MPEIFRHSRGSGNPVSCSKRHLVAAEAYPQMPESEAGRRTGDVGRTWICSPSPTLIVRQRAMPETAHEMVVDHAGRLHERIADRRADEPEAACFERLRQRIGFRRARRPIAGT